MLYFLKFISLPILLHDEPMFIDKASKATSSSEALTLKIDALFMVTMALLTVIVLADIAYKWYGLFSKKHTIN